MNKKKIGLIILILIGVSFFMREKIEIVDKQSKEIHKYKAEIQKLNQTLTKIREVKDIDEVEAPDGTITRKIRIVKTTDINKKNKINIKKLNIMENKTKEWKKTIINQKRLVLRLQFNHIHNQNYGEFGGTYNMVGPAGVSASVFKQIGGKNIGGGVGVSFGF